MFANLCAKGLRNLELGMQLYEVGSKILIVLVILTLRKKQNTDGKPNL